MNKVESYFYIKFNHILFSHFDNYSASIELDKYTKPPKFELNMTLKQLNHFIFCNFNEEEISKYKKTFVALCAIHSREISFCDSSFNKLKDVGILFQYIEYKLKNNLENVDNSLIGLMNYNNELCEKKITKLDIQRSIDNYNSADKSVLRSIFDEYIKDEIEEFIKNTEKEKMEDE